MGINQKFINQAFISKQDISEIEKNVIDSDGKINPMPYSFYDQFSHTPNIIKTFMWEYGIYVLPTQELIDWLRSNITGTAIEIGAGIGTISRALKIPITDSRMQELQEVKLAYMLGGQPVIKYHDDVEKLDAEAAIKKYKPDTVIGCFITHKYEAHIGNGNALGVQEEFILKNVRKYINIGNTVTHKDKPILKKKHSSLYYPWLITRSFDQSLNRIWVYTK